MTSHPFPTTAQDASAPSERSNWGFFSGETVRALTRALTPRPARSLTDLQRRQLRRMVRPRWQTAASCASADPVAWSPVKGAIPVPHVGRVCAGCPVRRSCLSVALLWNEDGIWAGTNPGHRQHGYRLLGEGVAPAVVVDLLLGDHQPDNAVDTETDTGALTAEPSHGEEAA